MWPDHHLQTHNENDDDGGDRVEVDDGGDTDNNDDDIHAEQNSSNLKMCSNGSVSLFREVPRVYCTHRAGGFVLDDTDLSAASQIIWTLQ